MIEENAKDDDDIDTNHDFLEEFVYTDVVFAVVAAVVDDDSDNRN